MRIKKVIPTITGFLEIKLDQEVIDYLWKIIEKGISDKNDFKEKLAGNIQQSYKLKDQNNYFYKSVCIPSVNAFRKTNGDKDPMQTNTIVKPSTPLLLDTFWVNYQYQNEFNPSHKHSGVYSFAIWMRIPYDWNEQKKLPLFSGMKEGNIKAGSFEFQYTDTLGTLETNEYRLSSELEGTMLFFPAALKHCVYPFYNNKNPRISISGNLIFDGRVPS